MRVAFISFSVSLESGGTTVSIVNFYQALKSLGITVHIYTGHRSHETIHPDLENNQDVKLFQSNNSSWWYSYGLGTALEKEITNYDIVHIHGIWLYHNWKAGKLCIKNNIPYVITPHGMLDEYSFQRKSLKKLPYWYLIQRDILKKASAFHCITQIENLTVSSILPNSSICVVANGITLPQAVQKKYTGDKVIGFIGRLHPVKGIDKLIKSFSILLDKTTLLKIAGGGDSDYVNYIFSLMNKSVRNESIKYLGFLDVSAKDSFYSTVSFLCIPSYSEGLSMVLIEALSRGIPCLITKQCNFDVLSVRNAGIVIPDNSIDNIVSGIEQMLKSNLEEMSLNARQLAEELFDIDKNGSSLLNCYNQVIHKKV